MPTSDQAPPARTARARAKRPSMRASHDTPRQERTRRMEAVMAALARVRAMPGHHQRTVRAR